MDNDRELLELAAKAAGIEGEIKKTFGGWPCVMRKNGHAWQPMHDDGDALRLACDLGLRVFPIARTATGAACSAVGDVTGARLSEVTDASFDTRAATRRAIVRAAASIGASL